MSARRALRTAAVLLFLRASAGAQPCVLCRTERCPTKADLTDWCGTGRDPLARPSESNTPRRRSTRPITAVCPPGQLAAVESPQHCCWPGQRYSPSAKRCTGAPSECPPERFPVGESCELRPASDRPGGERACPAGMARLDGGRLAVPPGQPGGEPGLVEIAAFCIDAHEVTVAEYVSCVHDARCTRPDEGPGCDGAHAGLADRPINCVSAADAAAFCAVRGARLPSAAEWEWAARGARVGASWPWGSAPPDGRICWDGAPGGLAAAAQRGPCAVGSHPAGSSPQGVADLAGNVAEWTLDGTGAPLAHGGSFASFHAERVGPSSAVPADRDRRDPYTGFRCAADLRAR